MASVFTKILNKEIPGDIIYEDEKYFALLDIHPVRDGHVLVIPKKEIDYIFDLSDEEYIELMLIAKKIALDIENKLKKAGLNLTKVAMVVEGIEVPHVHIHLIPLKLGDTLTPEHKSNLSLDEVKKIILG